MKLSTRLPLIVLIISVIIFTINAISFKQQISQEQNNSQVLLAKTLVQSMADAVVRDVILGEQAKLSHLLQLTLAQSYEDSPIEYLYVTGMNGLIFAHSYNQGLPEFIYQNIARHTSSLSDTGGLNLVAKYNVLGRGLVYEYEQPLIIGLAAQIHVGLNQSKIQASADAANKQLMLTSAIISLLCAFIAWLLAISSTRPLKQLTELLSTYHQGRRFDFSLIKHADPEVRLLSETLHDVFESRDIAEQEIRLREEDLNVTLDSIGDAVIATDDKGLVTRMNPIAQELTGWSIEEALGQEIKNIFRIIDETTRLVITNPIDKVLATGETVYLSNHTTLLAKNGAEYQIADSAAPIRGGDNKILGMVLVFNDVSEQYRLREQIKNNLQRLSLHWQESPLGMVEWNTRFEFINLNPAAEKMFGFSVQEVRGRHISENIVLEKNKKKAKEIWDKLITGTGGRRHQNENCTKDGRVILCDWYNTPLVNEEGQVIGATSLIMDITEQKRLEKLAEGAKKQLNQLMDGMLTMIATLLPDGTVSFINQRTLTVTGTVLTDVIGIPLWNTRWVAEDERGLIKELCLLAAKGETIYREMEVTLTKGTLWVDFSLHPVSDDHGEVIYLIAEARDASKRKLAEEHALRSQKMDALGQVVGGIAHDYNNMLGVITGYTGLLKRKYVKDAGAEKFLDEIIHATDRGKKLTQKMLNFSRPESGHAKSCNVNKLLIGVQDILSKALTSVILLKYDLDDDWLAWIDFGELEDAILNMAINAKHAMPEGGSLMISTQNICLMGKEAGYLNLAPNEYIKLSISDTGSGIDKALREKVFEPFFSTKGDVGNGLGLSQVFAFMQRSGGTINLYSQVGVGTQFNLYFPRYLSPDVEKKLASNGEVKKNVKGDETILVVDDEPALRELAREILLDASYRVLTASDGKDALDKLAYNKVDLILSDVIMPNMDGYQLAQYVKEHYPNMKIQLTSGFSGDRHVVLADSTLKDNLLSKPYDNDELLIRIRALLDGSASSKEYDGE